MARAFTELEKEQVRQALLRKGKEHFIRFGLNKTSVDEIAQATGIAKGTFYRFFASKEALFFAVHEASEAGLRADLMRRVSEAGSPAEKLRMFLEGAFAMLDQDPLMAAVFASGRAGALPWFTSSRQYQEHLRQGIVFMEGLLRRWQAEGIVGPVDTAVAANVVASLFFLRLQREELGPGMYGKVTDMVTECVASYLAAGGRDEH